MSDASQPAARPQGPHVRFAAALHATAGKLIMLAFRTRALDIDRIPVSGGAIIAGNHVSYADPVMVWCKAPRRMFFMGKAELWEHKAIAWAVDRVLAFPVRRGEADRAAITKAVALLKAGELVGMFPEGTRRRDAGGEPGEGQSGVAFVAVRAGVPIVPVGIAGTDRIRPDGARMLRFPRVTLAFGEPVRPEDFSSLDKRDRLEAMTSQVMERINTELERARKA